MVLKEGTDPDVVAKAIGATPKKRYTDAFRGFAADLTAGQLQKLDSDSRVRSLNEDKIIRRIEPMRVTAVAEPAFTTAGIPDGVIPPSDFAQRIPFGIERVGALESPTADIDEMSDRMNVDIAVIDSGVGPHFDLNVTGGVNCTDGNGFDDVDGHGTGVAGVAAAKDNAFGVVGVAPGARLWSVRVINSEGLSDDSTLVCGLDWVRRHSKTIEVANMSLAGPGIDTGNCGVSVTPQPIFSINIGSIHLEITLKKRHVVDPVHLAICADVKAGVTMIAGAGNDAAGAANVTPAAYPEVITVSGMVDSDGLIGGLGGVPTCAAAIPVDLDDHFADFSNFGQVVDIAAPSLCVLSTGLPLNPTPDNCGCYGRFSGTSFAAPHVAGAAALLKARHPFWSPAKVKQQLLATAEPGPIPGDPDSFPEGILNVRGY